MSARPDPQRALASASPREAAVWEALWDVEDPEMPVSIVDLGLVYEVKVDGSTAKIEMTLTYSGCPAREMIIDEVEAAANAVEGIDEARVSLVYSPPWSIENITEAGREALNEWGLAVPEDPPQSVTCQD